MSCMLRRFCMPANPLPRSKSSRFLTRPCSVLFLFLALFGLAWPQTTPGQPQSTPPAQSPNQPTTPPQLPSPSGTTQVRGAGVDVQNQQQGNPPSGGQPEPQTRITKAQAKELFRSVDEILGFASH